ncbi:hypothetical protein ACH347_43795 [Saccharopolyspora sp. 5N102]|uniref:hypothetical protein n=1 Tax=Saccharopolyspora sp. 5N102 TaxID=3375155 RepID=UPI0037A9C514
MFQASSAKRTFSMAVSRVNGGTGGRVVSVMSTPSNWARRESSLKRLYQLFPSKEALVLEFLKQRDTRWRRALVEYADAAARCAEHRARGVDRPARDRVLEAAEELFYTRGI